MKYFRYMILSLFIVGCGVMSNPKSDDISGDDNSYSDEASVAGDFKSASTARVLLKKFSDLESELETFKLIKQKDVLDIIADDLNLSTDDKDILTSIDLNSSNILYLPIKRSQDCGFTDQFSFEHNSTKIVITGTLEDCKTSITYYVPFYKIDKNSIKIEVKIYEDRMRELEF